MERKLKAYDLFFEIYNNNPKFKKIIDEGLENKTIRFFDREEWDKVVSQNFSSPIEEMKTFMDLFVLGYNIGNCVGTSRQLSYSYDDVDIVSGILPLLKGTLNAEKEGGHCWLETRYKIIDTTLMLIIDKKLKQEIGYIEEQRITAYDLRMDRNYQNRKDWVNDKNLKR